MVYKLLMVTALLGAGMGEDIDMWKILMLSFSLSVFVGTACGGSAEETSSPTETKTEKVAPDPREGMVENRGLSTGVSEAASAYFGELSLPRLDQALDLPPKPKTSVVLLVVDALNAKHLGVYGNEHRASPNVDKLAAEGVVLTGYVSNASWTRPSFATIVTGLPKNEHHVELKNSNIDMNITTSAERFRAAGYRTAGFVGNPLVREVWGFGQGFQVYEDTHSLNDVFPPDAVLADKAIDWLSKVDDGVPIYMMIFFTGPHAPYRPPRKHFLKKMGEGNVIEYPFREYLRPLSKADRDRMIAAYDDEILYTDAQIGRVVDALRKSGRLEHTVVAVTADHGESFGTNNCYTHTYHMWEPVLRVPFVLRPPASPIRGVVDDRPFTHVDVAPTLLAAAGITAPQEGLRGVSMLDIFRDPSVGRERTLFSQYNAHGIERQAMREGRWKLIHHHKVEKSALARLNELETKIPHADPTDLPSLATDGERFELYDLAADPEETRNLYEARKTSPEAVRLMGALTAKLDPDETEGVLSDEVLEALKNAGYIVGDAPSTPEGKGDTE